MIAITNAEFSKRVIWHHLANLTKATLLTLGLVACSDDGSGPNPPMDGGPGPTPPTVNQIENAGEFTLLEEFDRGDPSQPPETVTDIPVSTNVTASCTTQGWGASKVRELTNVVGLGLSGTTLYPGALLQGRDYENGQFVPITIPRSTGNLYMTGLVLDPGAQYQATDIPISGGNVNQAIQELITDYNVQGTTANASYEEQQTYSYESMLFDLGIDARYGLAKMEADLNIDSSKARNYVYSKFTQVFYDIVFEDPELDSSVFRDGASYSDPEGQIGPGNPPLYVSKVSYGRMVFFVAESEHDAQEVRVALNAAVRGAGSDLTVDSGLTYKEVLAKSRVYYYVAGGGADLALAPIASASPDQMFNAVKSFISDRSSANFSASNPGAPIAYTLNYLKDRKPARMSYTVNYDKKDCDFKEAPVVPTPNTFVLHLKGIQGSAWARVEDVQCGRESSTSKTLQLHKCMTRPDWNKVEIVLDRGLRCGNQMNLEWDLLINGTMARPTASYFDEACFGISAGSNRYFHWYFNLNKRTGEMSGFRHD
ncbi:MAG: thiol-activated cytolysin family protein [Granulosicoccus sp.]|nr:thiol-activated cytolysin family protein [Granulosicoccus sp.]